MRLTVVLDLDDTLYLERDYAISGICAVAYHAETRLGLARFGDVALALWHSGERRWLFDKTLKSLGHTPMPTLVAELVQRYRTHVPAIALAPDAERFLHAPHGCTLALITDGFLVAQRRKIAALALGRFAIDPVICTDRWGRDYWKPHPRAFDAVRASRRTGDPILYVADNPAKDFLAPQALGWATVQIDRAGAIHPRHPPVGRRPADMHIRSFDELTPGALRCLEQSVAWNASPCG